MKLVALLASLSLVLGDEGFQVRGGDSQSAEFKSTVLGGGEVSVELDVGSNGFEFDIEFKQEVNNTEFELENEARFVKLFQCVPTNGVCLSDQPVVKEIFLRDLVFVKDVDATNPDIVNVTFTAAGVPGKPEVTINAVLSKVAADANGAKITIVIADFPFDLSPDAANATYLGLKVILESSQECEVEDDDRNDKSAADSFVCPTNTGFEGAFTWDQTASLADGTLVNVNAANIVDAKSSDDDDSDSSGLASQQVILYSFQTRRPDFIFWDPSIFVTRSFGIRAVPSLMLLAVLLGMIW